MDIEVKPVHDPFELEVAQRRVCEIKIDGFLRMYDCGVRVVKTGLFGVMEKELPPQYFKVESKLTMEGLEYMDEYQIGSVVKQMYHQLQDHIKKYEMYKL
jgi:hypothetical protein